MDYLEVLPHRVRCIGNENFEQQLTIDKEYNVLLIDEDIMNDGYAVTIINDQGQQEEYSTLYFEPIEN